MVKCRYCKGETMSEQKLIVKLDFHYAVNTNAKTYWKVIYGISHIREFDIEVAEQKGILELLYTTKTANKTHWVNYYKLLSYSEMVKFKRIRISNRGNISVSTYKSEELKVEGEELSNILSVKDC